MKKILIIYGIILVSVVAFMLLENAILAVIRG